MTKKNPQSKEISVVGAVAGDLSHQNNPSSAGGVVGKASKNFPAKHRNTPAKIIPSHRLIFEEYKAQGFRHMGKAIRKTGIYSESVAKRVNVITKSKSWKMLMQEYMPDEHIALRHAEILDKRDTKVIVDADGNEKIVDDGPNTPAVTKGLDMAYKLRGAYTEDKEKPPSTVMYNLFYKPEVREQMKVFEEGIKQSLTHEVTKKNEQDLAEEAENERLIAERASDEGSDTQGTDEV